MNLLETMHKLGSFGTPIIMEFYANLSKDIGDPATSSFGKTMFKDLSSNSTQR